MDREAIALRIAHRPSTDSYTKLISAHLLARLRSVWLRGLLFKGSISVWQRYRAKESGSLQIWLEILVYPSKSQMCPK